MAELRTTRTRLDPGSERPAPAVPPLLRTGLKEIGRGRSGVVYRGTRADGRQEACKVFAVGDGLTTLVQWVFFGCPNPYRWNAHMIEAAYLRRRILAALVPVWTEGRVQVAGAYETAWNDELEANELRTEFCRGRAPLLSHPLRSSQAEALELSRDILPGLQARLIEAGVDGALWQAGYGNPVALNNFLLEELPAAHGSALGGGRRWTWIDLESGVPAVVPADARKLFSFYLPRCWRHRTWLFDDVDTDRLNAHLDAHEADLRPVLGTPGWDELRIDVTRLAAAQEGWRGLKRHQRAVEYRFSRRQLDPRERAYYLEHPLPWYAREARRTLTRLPGLARRVLIAGWKRLARIPWRERALLAVQGLVRQDVREKLARHWVAQRLRAWRRRGQLEGRHFRFLVTHVRAEESSAYLSDFGMHLALKPLVKVFEFWVLPVCFATGLIGPGLLAAGIVLGGPVSRTLYTGWRLLQSAARGREKPWVALGVGALPVVGNFAYPAQLLFSSRLVDDSLARFILHDAITRAGRHVPIWGGADTATEHLFNRFALRLFPSPPVSCQLPTGGESAAV